MSLSPSPQDYANLIAGRYSIRRKLGSGSLGSVYLAQDLVRRHQVAIKIIHPHRSSARAARRMQEEFQALASLRHPQIAAAYDFGYTGHRTAPFYTREYIEGVPLPPGPPGDEPPANFLGPVLDLLDALQYIHEHDILHLDIHPGNLIVSRDEARGTVLIDFGLVRLVRPHVLPDDSLSFAALPPEIAGGGQGTVQTDIFLAGRLLGYRLTGTMEEKPRLPQEIPGWGTRLTLELERIVTKALQPLPAGRFQSARELRDSLLRALGETERAPRALQPHDATVGREAELRIVEDGLRRVSRGLSSVLWFTGKSGLGKSRMLLDSRIQAQLRGLPALEVAFEDERSVEPLLLGKLAAMSPAAGDDSDWLEVVHPRHGGTPAERAERAAAAYFSRKRPPLVLLLDDLDAADQESRTLAEAILRECGRRTGKEEGSSAMLVIVTSQHAPSSSGAKARVIPLKPLRMSRARGLLLSLLKPRVPPPRLLRSALEQARGVPFHLGRIARYLSQSWADLTANPAATIPGPEPLLSSLGAEGGSTLDRRALQVLDVLAIAARPLSLEELSSASRLPSHEVSSALRRLGKLELVAARGARRSRRYALSSQESAEAIQKRVPAEQARAYHARLSRFLGRSGRLGPIDQENLARHLIASGRRAEGIRAARLASTLLKAAGASGRALQVLEDASRVEEDPGRRFELAEEISSILEEMGDHLRGIAAVEPFLEAADLDERGRVRVRRRLGVHYHRAGMPEKALAVFEEASRLSDPGRDLEDLVLIDSELAELHIFRGTYDAAEAACRRGLERLKESAGKERFRGRMQVMLRASLGHIELRRMSLVKARKELALAERLSRRFGTPAEHGLILHNLAIAENQLNDFAGARRHFRAAERILVASGEHRNLITIATNLAVIAAKLGEAEEAQLQVEKAARGVKEYPGARLEFFVLYSTGVVSLLLGKLEPAVDALERSLVLGKRLEDAYLVRFAQVYLAEAHLLSGRYTKALRRLLAVINSLDPGALPIVSRMAHSRLFLLEALLGRRRAAASSRGVVERTARTDASIVEGWNDIFLALGMLVLGEQPQALLDDASAVFRSAGIPFGARAAELGALLGAVVQGHPTEIRMRLRRLQEQVRTPHPFLSVAEALLAAESHFALGGGAEVDEWLERAGGEIAGSPFLELDWRIELLRARVSMTRDEPAQVACQIHRSQHIRNLVLELVPLAARKSFLAHPRFSALNEAARRASRSPAATLHSTRSLGRPGVYEGMVGQSPVMVKVFQTIERLRNQEVPVLITGETGTGKDLVARALHRKSSRAEGPFMAIHCASLPEGLFESEVFGHEAGAFTGAEEERPGLLEQLAGGTVLFDEVTELQPTCQAKLLRVIDSGIVRRLGGVRETRVDVRLLYSTSLDLEDAAASGDLRRDFLYRVRRVEIRLPPLRERREDVSRLAHHLLERHAARLGLKAPALEDGAAALLRARDWPGNVRELDAALLRAMITLAAPRSISARDLEAVLEEQAPAARFREDLLTRGLEHWRNELEREYLTRLFVEEEGNIEAMTARLGVKRTKLYSWLRDLGIRMEDLRRKK